MLALIGLGLFDENDLTLRGIDEARNSDKVYIELYTSKWHGNIRNLEKIIGKNIVELKRKDMEENSGKILDEARKQRISIFVEGDPLMATTHSSLLVDARKHKIETKVIHNASIVSVIGETGLHMYKFGPVVTIPFPEKTKGHLPESTFSIINDNKKRNLHTLCLLDVKAEEGEYMTVNEGLKILLAGKVVGQNDKIVVFAKAGSDKPLLVHNSVKTLLKQNISDIPVVIIILGKLHFTENDYLKSI
ncbi:MAG: diphthine synthase [Candidatus Aenigmarchaeota archaeon]|nr:diphthine synthase [Candidatus Aenigmarchaeota archaeon]